MINVAYGVKITGDVKQGAVTISGSVGSSIGFTLNGNFSCGSGIANYAGPYEVTPTQQTQILNTNDLRATSDITINPIPSNYGLITWNGSFLTVS